MFPAHSSANEVEVSNVNGAGPIVVKESEHLSVELLMRDLWRDALKLLCLDPIPGYRTSFLLRGELGSRLVQACPHLLWLLRHFIRLQRAIKLDGAVVGYILDLALLLRRDIMVNDRLARLLCALEFAVVLDNDCCNRGLSHVRLIQVHVSRHRHSLCRGVASASGLPCRDNACLRLLLVNRIVEQLLLIVLCVSSKRAVLP